jgi:uncharacterized protein YdhG (YjbR/CyaY superfamily)
MASKTTTHIDTNRRTFSDEERAAMMERARELKKEAKKKKTRAEGEKEILGKIAEMPKDDRILAEKIHEIVTTNAPSLMPKTWYGMPAYANGEGKVVCFFQSADKFKARYATLGFNDSAKLDEGAMWPTAFALTELAESDEEEIARLIKKSVS